MRGTHSGLMKALRILFSVLVICLSLLFLTELYYLNILSSQLFLLMAVLVLIVDSVVIAGLLFFTRRRGIQLTCSFLVVCLAAAYGLGTWYISATGNMLGKLTSSSEKVKNVINVYALKNSDIKDIKQLQNENIGVLSTVNQSGTEKLMDNLKSQGLRISEKKYEGFSDLAQALYDGNVEAIAVNAMYIDNITGLDAFSDFSQVTDTVYQFEYYTDVTYNVASVSDITHEPFTVMINGSDSRGGLGDTDRSDVNMLVTINPETKIVLMVSIPRDAYVETVCDPEYDCQQGAMDKLTHTGQHTFHTTQETIENFMHVDINYVFRANFAAVVDIVDALGGIDVDVAPGYAVDYFWTNDMFGTDYGVHEGINHLNGQAALCYARERYAYAEGDFQRIKNQQQVLKAIAQKITSPEVIVRYTSLLDSIDGNFWTDLSTKEIMDFIQFQISDSPDWTFISYSLSGEADSAYCAESYGNASVILLDQNTVKTAKSLIDAVKDNKTPEEINKMIEEAAGTAPDYSLDTEIPRADTSTEDYYPPVQDVAPVTPSYSGQTSTDTYTPSEPVYQEPTYTDPGVQTPVTPVQPTVPEPQQPVVPVTPSEPAAPVTPVEPVAPVTPVEPVVPETPIQDPGTVQPGTAQDTPAAVDPQTVTDSGTTGGNGQ